MVLKGSNMNEFIGYGECQILLYEEHRRLSLAAASFASKLLGKLFRYGKQGRETASTLYKQR